VDDAGLRTLLRFCTRANSAKYTRALESLLTVVDHRVHRALGADARAHGLL
jgi:hypothetical protein